MKNSRDIVLFRVDRKTGSLILGLLTVSLGSLAVSETLTLSTTYPSPSGIYNQLVTTGSSPTSNTVLNRNGGHTLLVPNTTNLNGRVGIGTGTPTAKLHVNGNIQAVNDICTDAAGGKCLSTVASPLSASYVGSCPAPRGGTCKCNAGERIMVMTGNSAGPTGYCAVGDQGLATVYGVCDGASAAASYFACFR